MRVMGGSAEGDAHCRGRGGVPHKHTGRVGGKNYVRQAQLCNGLPWEKAEGEGSDDRNGTKWNKTELN